MLTTERLGSVLKMECMLFADDWVWGDRGKEDDYEVTGLVVVS